MKRIALILICFLCFLGNIRSIASVNAIGKVQHGVFLNVKAESGDYPFLRTNVQEFSCLEVAWSKCFDAAHEQLFLSVIRRGQSEANHKQVTSGSPLFLLQENLRV